MAREIIKWAKRMIFGKDYLENRFLDAAYAGNYKEISKLIKKNASELDLNARGRAGITVLEWFIIRGESELAKLLIDNGADINLVIPDESKFKIKGKDDITFLHRIAYCGFTDIAEIMLSRGADVTIKDNDGNTPIEIAKLQGHENMVKLLEKNRDLKSYKK